MDIRIEVTPSQNITLVYDALDLQTLDRNALRQVVEGTTPPVIMDTPEMIVMVYPDRHLFVQIGDRRIRITLQQAEVVGNVPLWDYGVKFNGLAPQDRSRLIAYGYNYDVIVHVPDADSTTRLVELFVPDRLGLEESLDGKLVSLTPRLVFERAQIRYDLVLEPSDKNQIKAHFNVHFEREGITLPSALEVRASFLEEYQRLGVTLTRLLGESRRKDAKQHLPR
ncbi:MAG: hypothetical protein ACPL7R_05710 [Anaerolineae bacterium]